MTTTSATGSSWDISQIQAKSQTKTSDKADVKTTEKGSTEVAAKGLGDNFNNFLTLLTTQLKNQDPTKPMDSNEMTSQLVQFANVEQNIGTNTRLDKLLKMQQSGTASSNLSYLGKTVSFEGNSFTLGTDTKDTPLSYDLDTKAKTVEVKIVDSKGKTVRTFKGETDTGKHQVAWDYKDNDGKTVGAGTYKLSVAATANDPNTVISPKTFTFGTVVGVGSNKDGETMLTVDGRELALSAIASVH